MTTEMMPPGMGRCEVTGQILPEDELVTLNGQRVGAEGKAILLERLNAGEVLPGEAERPTILRRFACIFLDRIILTVPLIIVAILGIASAVGAGAGVSPAVFVTQLVVLVLSISYFTLMHGMGGRTLGKMAGNLRVVRIDGAPMNIPTALIRALAYEGVGIIPILLLLPGLPLLTAVGTIIVGIYGLANIITALVDTREQRALHDRIAGTRVVMIQK
jgi:uncharacterized RDD family membrane protein YckC